MNRLSDLDMAMVIVNAGLGSRVLELAREKGVSGGTIFLGYGTANRNIIDYLGLNDKKKEIVVMLSESENTKNAMDHISKELEFEKPNNGIAYVERALNVIGTESCEDGYREYEGGDFLYNAIYTIVDRGKANDVITAAESAGSTGGTVIHARGSGIHDRQKLFSIEIEPEKELVLVLAKSDISQKIVDAIRKALKIDEPGNGIIYVMDVKKTYGIRE